MSPRATFSIRDIWPTEYNGIRGYWRTYYPGDFSISSFKVFEALASDECPHDTYEVDSVSVIKRYERKDGTFMNQYITAEICCDKCGTFGEISIPTDTKFLKQALCRIDWEAVRTRTDLVFVDTGYPDWKARQDAEARG
jgi:hypothetical protein